MIKGIFWDNDGILVDTEVLYFRANKSVFSKLGVQIDEKSYAENFLKHSKGIWHLAEELGYSANEIKELRNERNKIYSCLLTKELRIIEGAESVLKKFYGKFQMSIVTSSRRDHFEIIHKQTGFRKYFDFEITSDECKETKPSPKPYLMALKMSRLKREECIVIEDSERGLKAAIAAGIKCYVVPTSLTKKSNFTGAEKILSNIKQLPLELL
jgi:HAD superfamily hydrolase (TIGR01509 family)